MRKPSKNPAPCYQCPDRVPACHDRCRRYQEWKAERERVREAQAKKNNQDVIGYERERYYKLKKG